MADTITILQTASRKPLAKVYLINENGELIKDTMAQAKNFEFVEWDVANIEELASALREIEQHPTWCVIRGKIRETYQNAEIVNRRCNDNEDGVEPAWQANQEGHHWLCIDMDNIPLSLAQNHKEAVRLLPECFWNSSYYYQFSAGHLLPNETGEIVLKIHLWFWNHRKQTDQEFRHWATVWNSMNADRFGLSSIIDASLFNPVQIHFTAFPIFRAGAVDPVPKRSGMCRRSSDVVDIGKVSLPAASIVHTTCVDSLDTIAASINLESICDNVGTTGFYHNIYTFFKAAINSSHGRGVEADKDAIIKFLLVRKGNLIASQRPQYMRILSDEFDKAFRKAYPLKTREQTEDFKKIQLKKRAAALLNMPPII